MSFWKKAIKKIARKFGYDISRIPFDNNPSQGGGYYMTLNKGFFDAHCMESDRLLVMDKYEKEYGKKQNHASGPFSSVVLREIEKLLPERVESSCETGCGKSTILFSNLSKAHTVFAFDDSQRENSSVRFWRECGLTKNSNIETVFGPTQLTLRNHAHKPYDIVLLDGPHGWPFPEFEYLMIYPYIKTGGHLIIDDVHIPTIGRMADIIAEDEMFDLIAVISTTAVFIRTDKQTFNPFADGWWLQVFNRRRVPWHSGSKTVFLDDGKNVQNVISSLFANGPPKTHDWLRLAKTAVSMSPQK